MRSAKKIVTGWLLGFVLVSIAALVVKETRQSEPAGMATTVAPMPSSPPAAAVAYYFHGTIRCQTCLAIERRAREAIESNFEEQIRSRQLVFQPVNLDEPQHRHFIEDFQLQSRSIVLARYKDGKPQSWKNLDQVWLLVHQPGRFRDYVTEEVALFLQEED